MLIITSFNEWAEGSNIEPSTDFGNYYLQLTSQFSSAYKSGSIPSAPPPPPPPAPPEATTALQASDSVATQSPDTEKIESPAATTIPVGTPTNTSTPTQTSTATATATPIASPTPQPDGQIVYTVEAGDAFSIIADRFDINLNDLFRLNNLSAENTLLIGQQLLLGFAVLPDGSTPLEGFPQAKVRSDGTIIHTVNAGDSFYGIAAIYDMTLDDFYAVSGLNEGHVLQVGDEVVVGSQPVPEEKGGSTNPPETLATSTPLPTETLTPPPTDPAPTPTAAEPALTATAVSTNIPTPSSGSDSSPGSVLPFGLGLLGLLAVGGILFLYLGRR